MEADSIFNSIIHAQSGKRGPDGQWSIRCPAHGDETNSASLALDGDTLLVHCHAGCAQESVIGALKSRDLWPRPKERRTEYYYQNLNGETVHRKTRIEPVDSKKTFLQSHLNGSSEWKDSAYEGELLPYHYLSWSKKPGPVFLVEGEKCADAIYAHGLNGTTTGGASDWSSYYARHFKGRSVIILPDNDEPGKAYASKAYDDIHKVARECHLIELPGLKQKQDVYDWFRNGHSADELLDLVNAAKNKVRIDFKTLKELEPTYSGGGLISGLLDINNQSCLYGESNVGKSLIALDMALHIVQGKMWFGKKTKKGAVMYIAAEAGPSIAQRTEAFQRHYDLKGQDLPFGAILASVDMFDKAADTTRIIEAIRVLERQFDQHCELVIIDTLAKAIAGANENAAQDMNAFLFNVDRIRHQAKTHVMVVHHCGKDSSKGARGHSSLRAAMDTEIEVFSGGLRVKKQRNMVIPNQPLGFKLTEVNIGVNDEGLPMTSCVVEERSFENNSMRRSRTSERALQALECLRHLIGIEPERKSFAGTPIVNVKKWKELFMMRHMLAVEGRSSRDMAFRRAAEELQMTGLIGTNGEDCWMQKGGHNAASN